MKKILCKVAQITMLLVVIMALIIGVSFPIYGIFRTPRLNAEIVLMLVFAYALLFSTMFSRFENLLEIENPKFWDNIAERAKLIFITVVILMLISIIVCFK